MAALIEYPNFKRVQQHPIEILKREFNATMAQTNLVKIPQTPAKPLVGNPLDLDRVGGRLSVRAVGGWGLATGRTC
jgi:hypothetical protein